MEEKLMQVFFGIYSAIFFTVLLGMVWPHKSKLEFWQVISGYIAKSLWLSWLLFLISYYTPLGDYLPALIITLTFYILLRHWFTSTPVISLTVRIPSRQAIGLLIFFGLLFAALCLLKYEIIFSSWDAVVSWNRWGIELSNNIYNPYNAAYPILFPGIWSLVYEAQGTSDIWITAKLTMLILPLLLILIMLFLLLEGRFLVGAIFTATAGLMLLRFFQKLTSGWMDYPVAALLLIGLTMLFCVTEKNKELTSQKKEIMLFGALFLGLASITKQAGALGLIPILFLSLFYLYRKEITLLKALFYIAVSLLPVILFLILFHQSSDQQLAGNLSHLRSLVSPDSSIAVKYLTSLRKILGLAPWLLLFLPFLIFHFKNDKSLPSTQLGVLCIGVSIIGYFIYTECCSYSSRNGAWIAIFLTISAMLGALKYEKIYNTEQSPGAFNLSPKYLIISIVSACISFSIIMNSILPFQKMSALQEKFQKRIGYTAVNEMIYKNKHHLGDNGVIITGYQYIPWLPGFSKDKYVNCSSSKCVYKTIEKHFGSLVLVHNNSKYHGYPEFRNSISKSMVLGTVGEYELIKLSVIK